MYASLVFLEAAYSMYFSAAQTARKSQMTLRTSIQVPVLTPPPPYNNPTRDFFNEYFDKVKNAVSTHQQSQPVNATLNDHYQKVVKNSFLHFYKDNELHFIAFFLSWLARWSHAVSVSSRAGHAQAALVI